MRTDLGRGHSLLRPPLVVNPQPRGFAPIRGRLTPLLGASAQHRRRRYSILRPPRVVIQVQPPFAPVEVRLTPQLGAIDSHRRLRYSSLAPPAVISAAPAETVLNPPSDVRLFPLTGAANPHWRKTAVLLQRPSVVGAPPVGGQVFFGPRVSLADQPRRRPVLPRATLPVIILPLVQALGSTGINLVRIRPNPTVHFLRTPSLVAAAPVVAPNPPSFVSLFPLPGIASRHHHLPFSALTAPTVVGTPAPPIGQLRTHTTVRRRLPLLTTVLLYPTVVAVGDAFYGPVTVLVTVRVRPTQTVLSPPLQITPAVLATPVRITRVSLRGIRRNIQRPELRPPTVIDLRPQVYAVTIALAYSRYGAAKSRLRSPVVVTPPALISYGPSVSLAYALRGQPLFALHAPTVIWPFVVPTVRFTLAASTDVNFRRRTATFLNPPAVINYPPLGLPVGPIATLAYSVRGKTAGVLFAPAVVTVLFVARPIVAIHLAPSRRGTPISFLSPPTDTVGLEDQGVVRITLASSRRGKPKSFLRTPTDTVGLEDQGKTAITLTYSRRSAPRSTLHAPAVVLIPTFTASPIVVHTVRIRPVATRALLREPVVVFPFFARPIDVTFAPQRRGVPKSVLKPPTDTIGLEDQGKVEIKLAYSLRGQPLSTLRPPTVVFPFVIPTIGLTLTPSTDIPLRHRTTALLAPPIVINQPPLGLPVGPIATLAYSLRGKSSSTLSPPEIVGAGVFYEGVYGESFPLFPEPLRRRPASRLYPPTVLATPPVFSGPSVVLAPQRRGQPRPFLNPPAVVAIDLRIYRPTALTLAYSRRGRSVFELKSPTVTDLPPQTQYLTVTLAYSRRGKPIYELKPPTVIGSLLAPPIAIALAYQSRRPSQVHLRPPVVVRVLAFFGPKTTLATIRPVPVESDLFPPTQIFAFFARPTTVALVRVTPPQRFWKLLPPTVVSGAALWPIAVTLAPSSRGIPDHFLSPPTVVSIPEPVLYPVRIALVEIRPPQRFWILQPPAAVRTFIPPQGDVCGSDEAGSDICGDDQPDTPNMTIVGGDGTDDSVCGGDEENT